MCVFIYIHIYISEEQIYVLITSLNDLNLTKRKILGLHKADIYMVFIRDI